MQLVFDFSQWLISPRQGVVGRQYDNLSHSLVVEGELPSGYTWDMLVEAKGKYNIIPLSATATGATASLTADQLAFGDTYYAFQLRGTSGEIIHHTNAVQVYVPDTIVGPGTWPVLPTEFSQAEANIKELNAHPPVPGENGYWMLWDLDTHSYVQSQLVVPGLHIEIGETTTGEPGTPANVTNSGTNTAPVLNFTIPEGEKGDAATIQVGTVTASDPGSEPQVKNSGTENAAVFDFVLPRGQTGPTGQAATIEVESTVTGEPGTQASVENVGTTGAAKLRFTIPRGNTGQNGTTPTLSAGNVETLEPGQPATASVTGEGPEYQINLGIPRGQTGAQGAPGQDGQDGQTPAIAVGTVTTLDPGQDATAEITGETPNLTLNLGIPKGQPGQDGVQLNDSAINTTEAWSSKKIVDTLCPAFTVEGNPVTCQPVEGYPLGVKVSFAPRQEGEGDPSPENVRPISGWDDVTVNVRGKNLFNISKIENTPSITNNGDGSLTVSSGPPGTGLITASTQKTLRELCDGITPGTYTINAETTDPNKLVYVPVLGVWAYGTSKTLTDEMLDSKPLYLYSSKEGSTATISNIQLELGSTPTSYEPYQPGTTTTLTLPETIYGGTVDAVTGVGEKTWEFVEFDGTEIWNIYPNPNDAVKTVYIRYDIEPYSAYINVLCDRSKFIPSGWTSNIPWTISSSPITNAIYITIPNDLGSTIESWKTYLAAQASAGTPVQVAYKLATPEPFQATGNQALLAVAGLNTLYTDGDSLAVSGRSDPLSTIQTMQAQITALQDQATQGGTS